MLKKLPKGWTPEQLSYECCKYERELLIYLATQSLCSENSAKGMANAMVDIINGDVKFLPIDEINDLIVSMIGLAMRDFLKNMAEDIARSKLRQQNMLDSIDTFLKDQGLSGIN